MPDYLVSWQIQLDADNHLDAIRQAIGILDDPHNTATVFEATDEDTGETEVYDMEQIDEPWRLRTRGNIG